jgi:hypothetical protein
MVGCRSILSPRRLDHLIAEPAQRFDHIGAHLGIVFDDKNALARAAPARLALGLGR